MKKSVLGLGGAFVALAGAGALYAAAASAPAEADPAAVPGRPMGDGGITWAQAQAQADALWQKMDVNKDGKIDQADRDARLAQRFDAIDTNHDGVISRAEFMAQHRLMKPGMPPMAGRDGDMPPPPPPPGGMAPDGGHHGWHGMGMGMRIGGFGAVLHAALRDKDGAVTRAAYDAAVKSQFDRADTNHDGKLTREEIRAAFGREGHRWGGKGGHGGPRWRDGERMDGPPPPPPAGN